MEVIMVRTILGFVFLFGMVPLQIFISRAERKWPGFILPIITFLFSFVYPFNMWVGTHEPFVFALDDRQNK